MTEEKKNLEKEMQPKADSTELVFILDKSGSMSGKEKDVIGGFNAMLEKQKKLDGKAYVTTLLFSDTEKTLHDRLPLEEIAPLTDADYEVNGCTALLDAIGNAIEKVDLIHKYIREEDKPTRTMFIITTDGMENASKKFTQTQIKALIRAHEELGWEFLFVAANIDAVETAEGIGIRKDRAANFDVEEGTDVMFDELSEVVCSYRACACIAPNWSERMEKTARAKKKRK